MTKIIFTRPEDGGVSVVFPTSGLSINNLVARTVPPGVEHEIVERDWVFPVDRIFRNAWTWEGKGKPILENLESSKAIAIDAMRDQTIADAKAAAEEAFFSDAPSVSEADVKAMYVSAESDINACTDPYAVKCLLCAFMEWDEPELPRDEQLKAKAKKAGAVLRLKLERIKSEVRFRVALAKKKYRLKEQIAQSEQSEAAAS